MDCHAEDDGVEIFAEHADEGRVGGLKVLTETVTLVGREAELARLGKEQFLIKPVELFGSSLDDLVGVFRGLDITAVEGLMLIDDEGDKAGEITILDTRHEGMVLAESTGENHRELRVLDDGSRARLPYGGRCCSSLWRCARCR